MSCCLVAHLLGEREIVINPEMAQLEMMNTLQYFKYDETNLLEEQDDRGKRDFRIKINMSIAVVLLCLVLFSRFWWTHSTGVLRFSSP
jgi:hypothetical protein